MSQPNNQIPAKVQTLNDKFHIMHQMKSLTYEKMKNNEEMFFSDVEQTGTQFTKTQLATIEDKYDIPISTKIAYAIVEQQVAFLTGAKPYPRLLSTTASTEDFTSVYQQLFAAHWYESGMNYNMIKYVQDCLVSGLGFLHIRKNDFYNETTFGVVSEYINWRYCYIDPHCEKTDLTDADYVCIAEYLERDRIEKMFDIRIPDDENSAYYGDISLSVDRPYYHRDTWSNVQAPIDKFRYFWVRRFYEKINAPIYMSENGEVSVKRPKKITIPNQRKEELLQEIVALRQELSQMEQVHRANAEQLNARASASSSPLNAINNMMDVNEAENDPAAAEFGSKQKYLKEVELMYSSEPDEVPAYMFELLDGTTVTRMSIEKMTKKRIRYTLLVGNEIIEEEILPCDEFPLIPYAISQRVDMARTYSVMHYINDLQKALNKILALMIYTMQTNANVRVLYAQGSVADPTAAENKWALPDAWIEYVPNPDLPDGGKPTIVPGIPPNAVYQNMLTITQQYMEYITGIGSVVQGQQASSTPDTFGGIQSLQTFGTQRIKLYARYLEHSLERYAYVLVTFLQAYAPKDQILRYLDEDGDQQELQIAQDSQDIKFKVRMNMSSNLPTQRSMTAQMLGILAGQTKDPAVQQLLSQYLVEMLDVPESKKFKEELNVIKNLEQKLQGIQQQSEQQDKYIKQLEQQLQQKELNERISESIANIDKAQALKEQEISMAENQNDLAQATGQQQTSNEDFPV